ncbi:hypothetical protein JCM15457_566 [Liquorilactobacillus sucicola DSM 21376 = JCM 15457]|uniref:GrpB family protein n=1 Tax=Liquorilactobacillus sucicola DSM 21376 = JCM 15457 TaxID=1423806 RepID=A0A023CUZ4_9LACO|nr:GrpB family protein [Liquorilactobacillus sucicola]KRN05602.1 hypothetical protein FD15_GL002165 [Liquorilactobacillus sucicola DSM 21376 = JCM 15457]GAJ25688.1 hypothetical protein JCM15457_566 [Liquorilactobacillus sucicola DSM 21376 = JCM 15457]
MKTRNIVVEPYNEYWPIAFERIRIFLNKEIGSLILRIEHVGSTAVPGLSAKPIIDLDVVIRDYSNFEELKHILSNLGYNYEGDLGIKDRHAFKYDTSASPFYLHHLYVCPVFSKELHKHLFLRNYLQQHPADCAEYGAIKQRGAELFPNNIEKYIAFKGKFIASIYKKMNSN